MPISIHLTLLDWLLIAAYGAVILRIGIREGRKDNRDIESYMLAGRLLTLPSFVATTVSTWYGGILGVGEYSYKYGLSNWLVQGVPYYIGALIFGLFLANRASKAHLMTIPDQIQVTYGSKIAVGAAVYVFFMTIPAVYVLMIGALIQLIFGVSLLVGVSIAATITTVYMFAGGFRSDVSSNRVNFVLMFGSIAIVLVVLLFKYGGMGFLKTSVPATHWSWNGGNSTGYILSWYLIAMSALIEPAFYQRAYAAKSPQVARRGILLCIPFWILFDFITTALGIYSRAILGPNISGMYAYPLIADKALAPGLKGLFFVGMIATIQSALYSYSLISASTLAHDVLWKARRIRESIKEVLLTRLALILSALLSIVIAVYAKSVINIWYMIGSLDTPGLMLPLALSYSPRWRYRGGWAATNMIISPAVVAWWFYARSSVNPAPFPYSIEPIYIGIAITFLLLGLDHVTRRRNEAP